VAEAKDSPEASPSNREHPDLALDQPSLFRLTIYLQDSRSTQVTPVDDRYDWLSFFV
jgi:hypothetical protein